MEIFVFFRRNLIWSRRSGLNRRPVDYESKISYRFVIYISIYFAILKKIL